MNTTAEPPVATHNLALPQQLARLDLDRLRCYRENLDFYSGLQWPGQPRARERRLIFNYARVFVDKVTSYLMSGLDFVVEPESPGDEDRARRAEEALYRIHEANSLEQLDFDTEIDAAILGDGCYKVTWDSREKRARVSAPDVQGIFVWWLGDDINRVWRVASRYRLSADEIALLYGVRSRRQRRESTVVEVWTDKKFELWIDDALVERKANPYGFIPFIIYPNLREPKRFWGVSDIPVLIGPARELNRALSWRTWRTPRTSPCSRERCGRSRSAPGPTSSTCCRAEGSSCTWTSSTCSTARCTTFPSRRAPHSGTTSGPSRASPWRWSCTPCCRRCGARGR